MIFICLRNGECTVCCEEQTVSSSSDTGMPLRSVRSDQGATGVVILSAACYDIDEKFLKLMQPKEVMDFTFAAGAYAAGRQVHWVGNRPSDFQDNAASSGALGTKLRYGSSNL